MYACLFLYYIADILSYLRKSTVLERILMQTSCSLILTSDAENDSSAMTLTRERKRNRLSAERSLGDRHVEHNQFQFDDLRHRSYPV